MIQMTQVARMTLNNSESATKTNKDAPSLREPKDSACKDALPSRFAVAATLPRSTSPHAFGSRFGGAVETGVRREAPNAGRNSEHQIVLSGPLGT
jgi:hypothetical protein